jgi:hypothetical protein
VPPGFCGDQQGDGFADDTAQCAALRPGEIVNLQTRGATFDLFLAPKMKDILDEVPDDTPNRLVQFLGGAFAIYE